MNYLLIDAHAHLWLSQDAEVNGRQIKILTNGKSLFMGEVRQMLPPYMTDGRNSAEIFLSNMDYAQVAASVITQEYIDGNQNDYLVEVQRTYPERFLCCGMVDLRKPGFCREAEELIRNGFRAIKIPAQRLITDTGRTWLTGEEMMQLFHMMQEKGIILSIDLADGATQVAEMEEIIAACPSLKIAIGHFGMVTRKEWQEQIKLARHEHVMADVGIRLSPHHGGHHLQDVVRLRHPINSAHGNRKSTLPRPQCAKVLWLWRIAQDALFQKHVGIMDSISNHYN